MAAKELALWGIHAGKTGDAEDLFLKKNYIGVSWKDAGDLSQLPADREAFRKNFAHVYPDKKPRSSQVGADQVFRFIHEMQIGDLVAYPSKQSRQIHIGQVKGSYEYAPQVEAGYPHIRKVKWLRTLPRTHFTQGALYEIGSAMSLFQIKNYADEFISAIKHKGDVDSVERDETIALVADEIEETTRDFILKRLSRELKGHPLAHFIANLLETMGYRTRVSPEGPDGGIDIIAHKDELGFEPPIIKVQVKSSDIGAPKVQELYGNVSNNEYGLFVTLGNFTTEAKRFARSKSNLRIIDGAELVDLIFAHYEQFDPRYKGLLPLKRVYIPEVLQEE